MPSLLEIRNLSLGFETMTGPVRVVDDLSLSIGFRETLGVVGESGSGKSVTALSIARLLASPPARCLGGEILLEGRDTLTLSKRELRRIRGGVVSYVFQDPSACLNPVRRIGAQVFESLKAHRPEAATFDEVVRLLRATGIPAPESRARDFPHQLSGGMQQRAMLAIALAPRPQLLVADEPTTALDVTIQAQILALLARLKTERRMSVLLITHNLGLVAQVADRVAVMYAGQIVELGARSDVLGRPAHPYTRELLRAAPRIGDSARRLASIPGAPPRPGAFPAGCRFHPRCPVARAECAQIEPALTASASDHWSRCPYSSDDRLPSP